jgi:alkylhydroperoxidase family enzyme
MSQELMNGPSPIAPGERELILAYAAGLMNCSYVCHAHTYVAEAWGMPAGLVQDLLRDPDAADLPVKLRALLDLVKKLAQTPPTLGPADIARVLDAGWAEKAVHDTVAVVARAAFMHRLVAGMGFQSVERADPKAHARKRIEKGYFDLFDFETKSE